MNEITFEDKRRLVAAKANKALTTGRPKTAKWGPNFLWLHPLKVDGYAKSLCALTCFDQIGLRHYVNTNYLDFSSLEPTIHGFIKHEIVPRFAKDFVAMNGPLQLGFPNAEALTELRSLFRELRIRPNAKESMGKYADASPEVMWLDHERLAFAYVKDALLSRTDKFDARIVVLTSQLEHLFYTDLNSSMQQNLLAWDCALRGQKIDLAELQEFRTLKPPLTLDESMYELASEIRNRTNTETAGGRVRPCPAFLGAIAPKHERLAQLIVQAQEEPLRLHKHWTEVLGKFPCEKTANNRWVDTQQRQLAFIENEGKYAKTKSIPDDVAHAMQRLTARISEKTQREFERLYSEPHAILEALDSGRMVELTHVCTTPFVNGSFRAVTKRFKNKQLTMSFICQEMQWQQFNYRRSQELQLHCIDMVNPELSSDKTTVRVIHDCAQKGVVSVFLEVTAACPRLIDQIKKQTFNKLENRPRYRWVLSIFCECEMQYTSLAKERAKHSRAWISADNRNITLGLVSTENSMSSPANSSTDEFEDKQNFFGDFL